MDEDEVTRLRVDQMHFHPDLTPTPDPHFDDLMDQALKGTLPVYYAAVPLSRITPFDTSYLPNKHPAFEAAVEHRMKEWREGTFRCAWVYPKGEEFVLSDSYVTYEAARRGQPEFLPCWIFGKPEHSEIRDLQGPLDAPSVRQALGFTVDEE